MTLVICEDASFVDVTLEATHCIIERFAISYYCLWQSNHHLSFKLNENITIDLKYQGLFIKKLENKDVF